jgi:hypothetical protein
LRGIISRSPFLRTWLWAGETREGLEKRAAFDPNDPEANERWVAEGGTLVYGPMLSGEEWATAKRAGAIQSAGQLRPTPKPYGDDRDGKPVTVIAPLSAVESLPPLPASPKDKRSTFAITQRGTMLISLAWR